jgi:hypothetical protein
MDANRKITIKNESNQRKIGNKLSPLAEGDEKGKRRKVVLGNPLKMM